MSLEGKKYTPRKNWSAIVVMALKSWEVGGRWVMNSTATEPQRRSGRGMGWGSSNGFARLSSCCWKMMHPAQYTLKSCLLFSQEELDSGYKVFWFLKCLAELVSWAKRSTARTCWRGIHTRLSYFKFPSHISKIGTNFRRCFFCVSLSGKVPSMAPHISPNVWSQITSLLYVSGNSRRNLWILSVFKFSRLGASGAREKSSSRTYTFHFWWVRRKFQIGIEIATNVPLSNWGQFWKGRIWGLDCLLLY